MESKRILIAVLLSIVVLLGWQFAMHQLGYAPARQTVSSNATATGQVAAVPTVNSSALGDPTAKDPAMQNAFTPTAGQLVTIDTPLYKAVFHSDGGVLQEFYLKKYSQNLKQEDKVNFISQLAAQKAPMGILIDGAQTWQTMQWALEGGNIELDGDRSGVIQFVGQGDGIRLTRSLVFRADSYLIDEDLRIHSDSPRSVKVAFSMAASALGLLDEPTIMQKVKHLIFGGQLAPEESQYDMTRVAWVKDGSLETEAGTDKLAKDGRLAMGNVSWAGVMNNYFLGAVSMQHGEDSNMKGIYADGVYQTFLGKTAVTVAPSQDVQMLATYFVGPKEAGVLKETPNNLGDSLDYGWFGFISRPLVLLLQFFYGMVHNYGVAIILMTILIKAVFWPLSQKSYESMEKMKQLQPEIQKLREKYKDDRESMNKEVMQLYKVYKVNPAGGCLPILLQLPVFIGLYQGLMNSIELRHASFIDTLPFTNLAWLNDLSAQDPFLITPLVMGATMFLQQKISPAPADPVQAKIMMLMPVIFTFIFLNFPSGLVLYWLVNNIISIGQQWLMHRKKKA